MPGTRDVAIADIIDETINVKQGATAPFGRWLPPVQSGAAIALGSPIHFRLAHRYTKKFAAPPAATEQLTIGRKFFTPAEVAIDEASVIVAKYYNGSWVKGAAASATGYNAGSVTNTQITVNTSQQIGEAVVWVLPKDLAMYAWLLSANLAGGIHQRVILSKSANALNQADPYNVGSMLSLPPKTPNLLIDGAELLFQATIPQYTDSAALGDSGAYIDLDDNGVTDISFEVAPFQNLDEIRSYMPKSFAKATLGQLLQATVMSW